METYYFKNQLDDSKLDKTDFIAFLGPDCTLDTYISQYRLAVNILIVQIEEKKLAHLNQISLPLLFMIRHLFELISKRFIFWFERRFNVNLPVLKLDNNSHRISFLSTNLLKYLTNFKKYIPGTNEKNILQDYISEIKNLGKILEKIDDKSYQFRYHIDNNKISCFDFDYQINCKDLLNYYYKYLELGDIVWAFTDYFPDPE
jgi:hypothetical protein